MRVQFGDGTGRGDGDCWNDIMGLALDQGLDGGAHRGAGGQAVVDEEDSTAFDGSGWAAAAEQAGSTGELNLLLVRDLPDVVFAEPLLFDNFLVYDLDTAFGDGAEGQFGLARDAELAYEPDVEGGPEGAGDLAGDGYASAQQAEDQWVDSLQLPEHCTEQCAGMAAVSETLGSCAQHATTSEYDVCDVEEER